MHTRTLKSSVFLLFLVPSIAFLYFSYLYIQSEYKVQQNALGYKYSVEFITKTSEVIHTIQLERGLSAGYLVTDSLKIKTDLLQRYIKTDEKLQILKQTIDEKNFKTFIDKKTQKLLYKTMKDLKNIAMLREKVLSLNITFEEEIKYYADINTKLLLSIKTINLHYLNIHNDLGAIENIQQLKELAGLERAYTYHELLTNYKNETYLEDIKRLKERQATMLKELFFNASKESLAIYSNFYSKIIEEKKNSCSNGVINKSLSYTDSQKCFDASTNYIDMLHTIYLKILNKYSNDSSEIYKNSQKSLSMTLVLWIVSLVSVALIMFVLLYLLKLEQKHEEDLRIAAHTFEAHEGVVITNQDGDIIRVNNSFSRITGYTKEEAIGQNPRILKSDRHSDEFYANIWSELVLHGRWQGEIFNKRKNGDVYPEMLSITSIKDKKDQITHYIAQFLDMSDVRDAQKLLKFQVEHDFLTGLLNRKALMHRLQEEFSKASRHNFVHAFLFIDLDNFKSINDNYGHSVGDKLIIEIAQRLKSSIREGDIVARISGDEFGVMLLNLGESESQAAVSVKKICTKILEEISKELYLETKSINISSSIGIKLFPDKEKTSADVIMHADKAMYEAKKQGKNIFIFFDKEIALELKEIAQLEQEIKTSLQENHFVFYYQPKVNLYTTKVQGAEMLIRWQHPSRGLLYPDSFLDIANSTGVIHHFSTLALHTGCKFIQANSDTFKGVLSINITAKELLYPEFTKKTLSIIYSYDIEPARFEFEITETSLIKNFDVAIKKILELKKLGIKFSIDDFGTGYSSMTYLQKLPVDTLKIDKWFLQDCTKNKNKEFVRMIINIAKVLDINVLAEGVETQAQLDFLKQNGCQFYQGFYFSKAVPEEDFLALL